MNSENLTECSISDQCNQIKDALNNWAIQYGGVVDIAENINEKVMLGWNNLVGPVCLVCFVGEESYGDEATAELTGRVRRFYDIMIRRGTALTFPSHKALTEDVGPIRRFYQVVEEARDIVRNIIFPEPMTLNPPEYHGLRPGDNQGWLMDCYIINISLITQIPRPQSQPSELGGGLGNDWISLQSPLPFNQNNPPE